MHIVLGSGGLRVTAPFLTVDLPVRCYQPSNQQPIPFFFNDPATTEIYTLSLHDALPIPSRRQQLPSENFRCVRNPKPSVRSNRIVLRLHSSGEILRADLTACCECGALTVSLGKGME